MKLIHKFVKFIPDDLQNGVIYISMDYATAVHKCCCGCGNQVVTPFSPSDWNLSFNGEGISLQPSIGNWSFPCQSHYWIENNNVIWAPKWTKDQIKLGRKKDDINKKRFYKRKSGLFNIFKK